MQKALLSKIIALAVPVMLSQISFTILNFVDRYFVASLGIASAAGSSLSGTVIWVLLSFSTLVSGGSVALIARKVGEKDYVAARDYARHSFFAGLVISIFIALGGFVFSSSIISFFQAGAATTAEGILYFRPIILFFPFQMSLHISAAVFYAYGNSRTPAYAFFLMCIANVILDPIFIFGAGPIPALGVRGAAYASVLSNALAFSVMLYFLFHSGILRLTRLFTKLKLLYIKQLFSIGIWTGLASFSRPVSAIFLQRIVSFHGDIHLAAFSFGIQWVSIGFILMEGLKVAVSSLVGQSLGERDLEKSKNIVRTGLFAGFVIAAFLAILGIWGKDSAISLFTDDPEVIRSGASYILNILYCLPFMIPLNIYTAAFNGAGKTMPPTLVSFVANWLGKVAVAAIASYYFGAPVDIVWTAIAISVAIEGLGVFLWFRKISWHEFLEHKLFAKTTL